MCAHERSFLSAYHRSQYIPATVLPPAAASAPVSTLASASALAPGAAFAAVLVPARIPLLF